MSAVVSKSPVRAASSAVSARRRQSIGMWIVALVIVLLLLSAPYWTSAVNLGKFSEVTYYAVAVMSVVLLTGRLGQISLGQGAYLGIGTYTTLLLTNAGVPWFVAIFAAALIPAFIGGVAGLPALRIKGLNLAIVSLGIAIVFPQFILRFSDFTGGAQGLAAMQPVPSVLGFNRVVSIYWIVVILAMVLFLLGWTLVTSRTGRALVAIRDQEIASRTLGINVRFTKVSMYAWAGAIAGLAGWMFALVNRFAAPTDISTQLSINLVLALIIGGGAGNIVIASVVGALFLVYVRDFVPTIGLDPTLTPVIYGAILILVLLFLPGGATGLVKDIGRWIGRLRRGASVVNEAEIPHGIEEEALPAFDASRDEAPIGGTGHEREDPVTGARSR
jgi:branched-chain amino acid transport system permease protein